MQSVRENYAAGVKYRLYQSKMSAGQKPVRTIRCPQCGFHLLDVYGYDHYLVSVRCRKCKFNEVIDTALFRTIHRKRPLDTRFNKRRR